MKKKRSCINLHYTKCSKCIIIFTIVLWFILLTLFCSPSFPLPDQMDFLGTATWTQMTILGAFLVFYLGSTRELRYGILFNRILAWVFGAYGVGTILCIDMLFVIAMTLAYYVKAKAVFFSAASISILIQFGILIGFVVMNSKSILEGIILNRVISDEQVLASDIVTGTEPMEEKVRLLGKIFSRDKKRISRFNVQLFRHILRQFEAIYSRLSTMNKRDRLQFYSMCSPVILDMYEVNKEFTWTCRLWMGAFIITSLQSKDDDSFDPFSRVFFEFASSEEEWKRTELAYLLAILIHAMFFLFASERLCDEKRIAQGFKKLIRKLCLIYREKGRNENLLNVTRTITVSRRCFFQENLSFWIKGYDILNESLLPDGAILSSLNGLSFQGEVFTDFINGVIMEYSDDAMWKSKRLSM